LTIFVEGSVKRGGSWRIQVRNRMPRSRRRSGSTRWSGSRRFDEVSRISGCIRRSGRPSLDALEMVLDHTPATLEDRVVEWWRGLSRAARLPRRRSAGLRHRAMIGWPADLRRRPQILRARDAVASSWQSGAAPVHGRRAAERTDRPARMSTAFEHRRGARWHMGGHERDPRHATAWLLRRVLPGAW